MTQHRHRASARHVIRKRAVVAAAFVGTIALGTGVGVWASSDGGGGERAGSARHSSSGRVSGADPAQPAAPSASPSPTRSYPLSRTPRTIPAVRSHTAARGPGWRPRAGGRVVVSD
ncbi:beta-N-acetylglucosaminidase, partial [Streptomyces sp. SID161]|nr:beta-N-acetylglucosaminidase [Streptomyces sp. SID161]